MKKSLYLISFLIFAQYSIFSQPNSALPKIPIRSAEHWMFRGIQDTIYGNWLHIAPLPQALYGVLSYYWQDSNKIFICGGADSLGHNVKNCYYYNISANTYEPKASLPLGRAFGKLVRVRDSLYLVGSVGPDFHSPDGALYKYDPDRDTGWVVKASAPAPALQEMAVCVWRDSLIFTIGGSTDGFTGVMNTIMSYDPFQNLWVTYSSVFPSALTTADAECVGDDFLVVGGFDGTVLNSIYRGFFQDTLTWVPLENDSIAPFRQGIYRVGGNVVNNMMLFGPGLRDTTSYGQIWGFYPQFGPWVQFLPNTLDTAGDIPTIAVRPGADSLYFYLFGGILPGINPVRVTAKSERYSLVNPFIGIQGIYNTLPVKFKLYQNYPNPFNPSTFIKYDLPGASEVKLTIVDILGREVKILVNEFKQAGSYKIEFNAGELASGIYFCRMISGGYTDTKKIVLLK